MGIVTLKSVKEIKMCQGDSILKVCTTVFILLFESWIINMKLFPI